MPGGWGGKQPQIPLIMGQDTEREESEQVGHMLCYTADSGQGDLLVGTKYYLGGRLSHLWNNPL